MLELFDRAAMLNKRTLALFTGARQALEEGQPVQELFDRIYSIDLALRDSSVKLMAVFPETAAR